MGNLVNTLRQLIREEIAITEDRLGKGLVITSPEKVAKIKRLYPENSMIYKIIIAIEGATDYDMTRLGYKDPNTGTFVKGLAQILNLKNTIFGPQVKELIANDVIADKVESVIPKKEKPDKKGRKASDTSKEGVVRLLAQRWMADPEYVPSEAEITYVIPKSDGQTETFTADQVAKLKAKTLGLSKRGRKSSGEDSLLSRVNRALSEEPLHEAYRRLQKIK